MQELPKDGSWAVEPAGSTVIPRQAGEDESAVGPRQAARLQAERQRAVAKACRRRDLAMVVGGLALIAIAMVTAGSRPGSSTSSTTSTGSRSGALVSPSQVLSQTPAPTLATVAGLGPRTAAGIPAQATRAVVVRGDAPDESTATIELYAKDGATWTRVAGWRGHVGARGWTTDHREGDLRTPVGTFTLSDAGGLLPDPGTRMPYHRSSSFVPRTDRAFGDSLEGSFDYVVAIDYNRRRGVSPLDQRQPLGAWRGGGIWMHVDHDGPTHGCVSVPRAGMRTLLRALAPAHRPVVVMADRARLTA
ncbi:MAG: L,D-transpeptidase family protein [Angustibacter sp.]